MEGFPESLNYTSRNVLMGKDFPGGPVVKNPPSNAGDAGSIPSQGTKIPRAGWQLSPRTTTSELTCCKLQSPRTTTREKPTQHHEEPGCNNKKMPLASTKILHAATKIRHSQK